MMFFLISQPSLGQGRKNLPIIAVDQADMIKDTDQFNSLKAQAKAQMLEEDIKSDGPKSKIEVIVDSSGSMGQILAKNKTKMYYLKELMKQFFLARWKEKNTIGLRTYGGRFKNKCEDIRMLVPFGKTNIDQMEKEVATLSPLGMTPLHKSLTYAFDDLKSYQGPKRVVIVTDGDDTCGGDPCQTVEDWKKQNLDLKFYVVALGMKGQSDILKKIKCIGETSVANDDESFQDALSQIGSKLNEKTNLQVISPNPGAVVYLYKVEGDKKIFSRSFYASSAQTVPPGQYEAIVGLNPPYKFSEFTIPKNKKITLKVAGEGELKVNYFNHLLNAEVLDKNNKVVVRFKSDELVDVPMGKWRLRVFKDPFFEQIFPEFFVYPGGKNEFDITGVGAFKVMSPQLQGVYVYDQDNKELGDFLTGFTAVIKSGIYQIHVDDKCSFEKNQIFDRKELLVLTCPNQN